MKKIIIYSILLITASLVLTFLIAYPTYSKKMESAKKGIASESLILANEFGKIEYAIRGEGHPVLLLHGAGGGYDQGLWFGEISLTGGYKFIAPSRFGYLGSSIPGKKSIKLQAEIYKPCLII